MKCLIVATGDPCSHTAKHLLLISLSRAYALKILLLRIGLSLRLNLLSRSSRTLLLAQDV